MIRVSLATSVVSGNAEFADYVIRWIAWAIQNPAAQAEVALVLIGFKGAGKGTLVRCLQRITAVATAALDGNSFGELLDRAIARQERAKQPPKMIEGKALPVGPLPADELKAPFPRMRRRV